MKKLFAAICLFLIASPVHAAGRCYSPVELQAEKVLRLHSELMVITVTCKQASTGRDLVHAYTGFTKNNLREIQQAEATLISHYEKTLKGKGIAHLDKLRTKLANNVGQVIANESAPIFCGARRDYVIEMAETPLDSLGAYASKAHAADPALEPLCKEGLKTAAVSGEEKALGEPSTPPAKPKGTKKKKGT